MDRELFYIDGYTLDEYQIDCVKCNNNLLVIAGAGCGKTSTILGKVKYLISLGYKEEDILCMSLTNEATNGLKNKLLKIGLNIDCFTFHKLGLNIINMFYDRINVCSDNTLEYIVAEYFLGIVRYSHRRYLLFLEFKCFKYKEIIKSNEFSLYKRNIITFINLFKNKGHNIYKLFDFYTNSTLKHNYLFILEIYLIYYRELRSTNSFDFNDMISYASELVYNNKIKLKYKYIIIDEFQDTSLIRLDLIRNIINNNNSKIMCVGDDYQSIYRFAGSDIELFLNFNKYFDSKELLYISNNFICKNKYQIKKELLSNKSNNKPIKIIYSNNKKETLYYLINMLKDDYMIIGRNNKDIYDYVDNYEDINNINYYTAHKSKGLESSNTILINLTNDILGFPSKVKNNKFVNKLFDKDLYKYDEERRLFYVALTRTKNSVYMIVDRNNISIFVKELIRDYKNYIEFIK